MLSAPLQEPVLLNELFSFFCCIRFFGIELEGSVIGRLSWPRLYARFPVDLGAFELYERLMARFQRHLHYEPLFKNLTVRVQQAIPLTEVIRQNVS